VIELERPRDAGALLRDSLVVYIRHFWTFLALGALVVVPAELIVNGIGMEELTSGYDTSPTVAEVAIPSIVTYLVVGPLITAICVYALQSVAAGGSPGAGEAIVRGFESFSPIFFAVLLAALGTLAGAILIVPGVYLFVRWYFVPQAVVLEGARGPAALRASGRVVEGSWWRTLGLIVLVNLVALVIAYVLSAPFVAAADSSDRALWALIGESVASSLVQPFAALYSTFLYFDLKARKRAALG
jgi:hypothetical protein